MTCKSKIIVISKASSLVDGEFTNEYNLRKDLYFERVMMKNEVSCQTLNMGIAKCEVPNTTNVYQCYVYATGKVSSCLKQ